MLSRFSSVSDHLTPAMPASDVGGDPSVLASVPPFFWQLPTGDSWSEWHGFDFQAALDQQFTSVIWLYQLRSTAPMIVPPAHTYEKDFSGDNSYYWRVRQGYDNSFTGARGGWSQPFRFERLGLVPDNLQTSVTFATPTFSWNMAEGAEAYELQVDGDPNFGSPDVSATTSRNSHTPSSTLANGTYYWRVQAPAAMAVL